MRVEQFETSEFGEVRWNDDGDYFWFDPKPIPRRIDLEPETLLALSEADAALGRLSGVGGMLREPGVLMRPYAIREALASARIEGTQASLSEIFQAEANSKLPRERDVLEVTAHISALEEGLRISSDNFDLQVLCAIHARLMKDSHKSKDAGNLRSGPVWLGSPTARPETAVFVPPVGEAMHRALADLEDFLKLPPRLPTLIKAALLHYQFLTVHPFFDGNGRIGRMMVLLFLRHEHRLAAPLLYVSPYFAARRREYYDRLQAVRERGEIQQWLQFFLTAVAVQANDGVIRARELLTLRERYRSELSGSRSRAIDVVEMLFMNPVITTSLIRNKLGVTNQGALNLARSLEARKWLIGYGAHGRGGATHWLAPEILDVIARDDEGILTNPSSAQVGTLS